MYPHQPGLKDLTSSPVIRLFLFMIPFTINLERLLTFRSKYLEPQQLHRSCQKGLFLDRVLISPRTENALAAAVTKLMAPMALVACQQKKESRGSLINIFFLKHQASIFMLFFF